LSLAQESLHSFTNAHQTHNPENKQRLSF